MSPDQRDALKAVARLIELVPPPADPLEIGSAEEWNAVEKWLGVELPADYRTLCQHYGSGVFRHDGDEDYFLNPFSPVYEPSIEHWLEDLRSRRAARTGHHPFPFPVFPDLPGVFPIGNQEYIRELYYLVHEDRSGWSILYEDLLGEGEPDAFRTREESLAAALYSQYQWLIQGGTRIHFDPRPLAVIVSG